MQYARKLRKGDKVAIVSLSSGMLGEEFCSQLNCNPRFHTRYLG